MPPRAHECGGGDRDEGAGRGEDSPNEAPQGLLCKYIYMMKHDSGGDEVVVEYAERESITDKIPRGPRDFLASHNSTNQIKICL